MKKVAFIRHYKLEYPFDSNENISHEQYVALSKGEIDPSINHDLDKYVLKELDINKYRAFELILTSPTKRTLESASKISEIFNLNAEIKTTDMLKECVWNPDLPGKHIDRFIQGTELSTLAETWERIKHLDDYLKSVSSDNILCVTHSFFMQILYLYHFGNFDSYKNVKYDDIRNSFHGDYLKGFTVNFFNAEN